MKAIIKQKAEEINKNILLYLGCNAKWHNINSRKKVRVYNLIGKVIAKISINKNGNVTTSENHH
jgi:hypothetical protein